MSTAVELALKADAFKELRTQRLTMQRSVDTIKEAELTLRAELLQAIMEADGLEGVVGKLCTVKHVTKTVPSVVDREAFQTHVRETGNFELMTNAISAKAIQERWELGEVVPGISPVTLDELSVTKA